MTGVRCVSFDSPLLRAQDRLRANGEVVLRRLRFLGCAWNDGGAVRVLREPQGERGVRLRRTDSRLRRRSSFDFPQDERGDGTSEVYGFTGMTGVRAGPFERLRANGESGSGQAQGERGWGRGDAMVFVRGISGGGWLGRGAGPSRASGRTGGGGGTQWSSCGESLAVGG